MLCILVEIVGIVFHMNYIRLIGIDPFKEKVLIKRRDMWEMCNDLFNHINAIMQMTTTSLIDYSDYVPYYLIFSSFQ